MLNPPWASDTAVRVAFVAVHTALTVTPGRTAPVPSMIVPVMSPVVFCASAVEAEQTATRNPMTAAPTYRITPPPSECEKYKTICTVLNLGRRRLKGSYARNPCPTRPTHERDTRPTGGSGTGSAAHPPRRAPVGQD